MPGHSILHPFFSSPLTKITPTPDPCHPALAFVLPTLHQQIDNGMTVIFLLILISLILALGFLGAFFCAVKGGQYDDDYTPSIRMLLDDDKPTDTKL